MEALLLCYDRDEKPEDHALQVGVFGEKRVGRHIRYHETPASGVREREQYLDDWRFEIQLFLELLLFDSTYSEIGFGEHGMGGGWTDASGDVQVVSREEQVQGFWRQ